MLRDYTPCRTRHGPCAQHTVGTCSKPSNAPFLFGADRKIGPVRREALLTGSLRPLIRRLRITQPRSDSLEFAGSKTRPAPPQCRAFLWPTDSCTNHPGGSTNCG